MIIFFAYSALFALLYLLIGKLPIDSRLSLGLHIILIIVGIIFVTFKFIL